VLRSDSSALARDCRKEIKALTQQIAKLSSRCARAGPWGWGCKHQPPTHLRVNWYQGVLKIFSSV
jgi:hypothetical protein